MQFRRRKTNFTCCRNSVQPHINSSPRRNWHRFTNQFQKPVQPKNEATTEEEIDPDTDKDKSD